MTDSYINTLSLQLRGDGADIGLPIVIWEEHTRLNDFGSTDELLRSHGVGLVARQECDIDVLNVGHLGDVLCVASDIDAQAVEGQDVAVVSAFGMKLSPSLRNVVCRNCLN